MHQFFESMILTESSFRFDLSRCPKPYFSVKAGWFSFKKINNKTYKLLEEDLSRNFFQFYMAVESWQSESYRDGDQFPFISVVSPLFLLYYRLKNLDVSSQYTFDVRFKCKNVCFDLFVKILSVWVFQKAFSFSSSRFTNSIFFLTSSLISSIKASTKTILGMAIQSILILRLYSLHQNLYYPNSPKSASNIDFPYDSY